MSENTPKLDLLMKDPVLDGHEYFNVKTMMNDNWEKIDTFADTVDGEVKELQQRLDTEQRKEITLQPGLQIIESDKTVPFRLTGLKGRTLVNLLGRRGSMDSLTGWFTTSGTTAVIDTSLKSQGTGSAKVTISGTNGTLYMPLNDIVDFTKHHLIVADLRKGNSTHVSMSFWNGSGNYGLKTVTASSFTPAFILVPPNQFNVSGTNNLQISVNGATGQYSYADAVRVYGISADEYAALGNMSAEQVAAKYPYVDSVKPVRNPYVIRHGENLLPPFYEWTAISQPSGTLFTIDEPYKLTIKDVGGHTANFLLYARIKVKRDTEYTLSFKGDTWNSVTEPSGESFVANWTKGSSRTFQSGNNEEIRIYVSNYMDGIGTYNVSEPMLNIGSEALTFVPNEESMLAFQMDLYADPLTGANADNVFELNGQYFKAKRWSRVVLGGEQAWTYYEMATGVKFVRASGASPDAAGSLAQSTKFDGKVLKSVPLVADSCWIDPPNNLLYIGVSTADSGWGDSYTPTDDEIKAYFNGWKMSDVSTSSDGTSTYNRTDGLYKGWSYRAADNSAWAGGRTTLPTTQSPAWSVLGTRFSPYEIVYQLATSTIESIVSEGQFTLNEGSNQVEVGTGIVLRELTTPYVDSSGWMNLGNPVASPISKGFRNVAGNILGIYRNSRVDSNWTIAQTQAYGALAQMSVLKLGADFDSSAAYTVTYLMRDLMPVAEFVGSVPENEKSLLAGLVQDVQKASSRLSVVESKKAEGDSPSWISPTLLNGWRNYDTFRQAAGYYKDSTGRVHVFAYLRDGISSQGSTVFVLPPGFRPQKTLEVLAPSVTTTGTPTASTMVLNGTNGAVTCNVGVANGALLLDFSFLAL